MKNFILTLKNRIRYYLKRNKTGGFYPEMLQALSYEFEYMSSIDHYFFRGFAWGFYHPDHLYTYFNNECMDLRAGLRLWSKLKPRVFNTPEGPIEIPYGHGVVRSKKKFKYGYFEAELKLPEGEYSWPAFWLTGVDSWPPEIDVLEGYSDDTTTFHHGRKLQSNIHYGTKEKNFDAGAKNHFVFNVHGYNKYGVLWTPDEISFYYNRHLVRTIKDNMEYFNQEMEVIFGCGPQRECDIGYAEMRIKSLNIWQ